MAYVVPFCINNIVCPIKKISIFRRYLLQDQIANYFINDIKQEDSLTSNNVDICSFIIIIINTTRRMKLFDTKTIEY